VLQQGDSSRLYQTLNKEKELVINVGGFVDERIGPSGLYIGATVRPGKKAEDVEAAIYSEVERLQQQPIAEWELEKAKNTTRFGYLQSVRSAGARATMLGTFTVKFNDPGLINTRIAGFDAVTRADVQRVAKKYLQAKNRTVIVTNPAPPAAAAPGA
jgi:zinc protease